MFSPALIAEQVTMIASVFEGVAPQLVAAFGGNADKAATVGEAIDDLRLCATAFAGADNASAGDLVERFSNDVQAVTAALVGTNLPPQVQWPLRIASLLVPVVAQAAEMVWQHNVTPAVAAAPAAPTAPPA